MAIFIIPQNTKKQKWGESSGARNFYRERNEIVYRKYKEGISMEELSEEFSLSVESIRKIIYKNNEIE